MAMTEMNYMSGGGGADVEKWDNPNPTSTFAGTTIPFNTSGVKAVIIKQIFSSSYSSDISYDVIDADGGQTSVTAVSWHNPYSGSYSRRTYTIASDGIQVSNALDGSANNYAIPQYIKVIR